MELVDYYNSIVFRQFFTAHINIAMFKTRKCDKMNLDESKHFSTFFAKELENHDRQYSREHLEAQNLICGFFRGSERLEISRKIHRELRNLEIRAAI